MTESSESNRLPMLAADIRRAHADVQDSAKTAAESAIDAGHSLIEAKTLVKHGEWLQWLRDHCALPERTAQLYMKIAKSGHSPDLVAQLGLKAAEKALILKYCFHQPLFDGDEETRREWHVFALYLAEHRGWFVEGVCDHIDWIGRKDFQTVEEWLTEGPKLINGWGGKMSDLRGDFAEFSARYDGASIDDLGAKLIEHSKAHPAPPPAPVRRRNRKRKSATVADLGDPAR